MIFINRQCSEDAENAIEVDEEMGDEGEEEEEVVDGIMGDDGKESGPSSQKSDLGMAALTDEQVVLAALESNQLSHPHLRKRYYSRL